MFGEFDRAHAVLDDIDDPRLSLAQRRLHSLARAWLWIFQRRPGWAEVQRLLDLARSDPQDPTRHALLVAALPLLLPLADAADCLDIAEEIRRLEVKMAVGSADRARARAVEAGCWLMAGRLGRAVATLVAATESAVQDGDAESATVLGGNCALMAAMAGRVDVALRTLGRGHSVPGVARWPTFAELAQQAGHGARSLAGPRVPTDRTRARPAADAVADPAAATLPLVGLFRARALALHRAAGREPDDRRELLAAIRRNLDGGQSHYVLAIASELLDVRDPDEVHRVVRRAAAAIPGSGLAPATQELSQGRLERDPARLLAVAEELEGMGFVAAATHAAADALRVQPPPPGTTVAARRALVRLRRRWRGAEPWWVDDAPGVPTPHQVDVAVRVAELGSAEAVAQERTVSRRTVENHVYRVARALALSDRDELLQVVRSPRTDDDGDLA